MSNLNFDTSNRSHFGTIHILAQAGIIHSYDSTGVTIFFNLLGSRYVKCHVMSHCFALGLVVHLCGPCKKCPQPYGQTWSGFIRDARSRSTKLVTSSRALLDSQNVTAALIGNFKRLFSRASSQWLSALQTEGTLGSKGWGITVN